MRRRNTGISTVVVTIVLLLAAAAPPARAANFDLCSNWDGWRYGGDGFDYASRAWGTIDGHWYHSYWQRSVLNGTVSSWRIRCT